MEQLIKLLEGVRADIDFEAEKKLIDDEVLDSFDIVNIVSELNEKYDIDIDVEDLTPENFNSVESIYALVTSLQKH